MLLENNWQWYNIEMGLNVSMSDMYMSVHGKNVNVISGEDVYTFRKEKEKVLSYEQIKVVTKSKRKLIGYMSNGRLEKDTEYYYLIITNCCEFKLNDT